MCRQIVAAIAATVVSSQLLNRDGLATQSQCARGLFSQPGSDVAEGDGSHYECSDAPPVAHGAPVCASAAGLHVSRSPGWQSSASHSAASVENRIARGRSRGSTGSHRHADTVGELGQRHLALLHELVERRSQAQRKLIAADRPTAIARAP